MTDDPWTSPAEQNFRDAAMLRFARIEGVCGEPHTWDWPTIRDLLTGLLTDFVPSPALSEIRGSDVTEIQEQFDNIMFDRQRQLARRLCKECPETAEQYVEVFKAVEKPVGLRRTAKWTAFLEEIDRLEKEAAPPAIATTTNATPQKLDRQLRARQVREMTGWSDETIETHVEEGRLHKVHPRGHDETGKPRGYCCYLESEVRALHESAKPKKSP